MNSKYKTFWGQSSMKAVQEVIKKVALGLGLSLAVAVSPQSWAAATSPAAGSPTLVRAVASAATPASTLYYVHPDHLGTPRLISDQSGITVWRWDNLEAFGTTGVQEDPDGDGRAFTFNLRFAGQYYDQESGLSHNGRRDYDSATGRYVQADPIGLDGGISLYSYVAGQPTMKVDPKGLFSILLGGGGSYVPGLGGEASGGVYLNPGFFGQCAAAGLYGTGGMGGGYNMGFNAQFGFVLGSASNVNSPFLNLNISTGLISLTIMFDPSTRDFAGLTFGPAAELGVSLVYTDTGKTGGGSGCNCKK